MKSTKGLVSFDLDDTISQGCLEGVFFQYVPNNNYGMLTANVPWCSIVQELILKANNQVTEQKAREHYKDVEVTPGIKQLIKFLYDEGYELLLVSGSNKMFANDYLKLNGLHQYFSEVICNSLEYVQGKGLVYEPFCTQTTVCDSKNCRPPCKKKLILDYLKDRKIDSYYHVGDGRNDFCPMTMTHGTKAFIRQNYVLHNNIKDNKNLLKQIPGQVVYWKSGYDIIKHFQK